MCKNYFLPLIVFVLFALSALGQETYRDNFTFRNYGNNDGSSNFSTNWLESNDDNSPSTGRIDINTPLLGNGRLRFEDLSANFHSIRRSANLSNATSVTLSFDYQTSGLDFREYFAVQVSSDGVNFTTLDVVGGSTSGFYSRDITVYASANTTIRFRGEDRSWESGEFAYVDNFQLSVVYPTMVTIEDVSVNEDAGTATFTATVGGVNAGSPFSVNYQTVNGSANAGSDYTSTTGTLNFNGNVGNSATITVPILDDALLEGAETFTVQMTSSSNPSIVISDTATGTVIDDEGVIMTNGATSTQCGAIFLDPGRLGNYGNNLDVVHTICPDGSNDYVEVNFTQFDVEAGYDFLYVYEGTTTGGTLIGQYHNGNIPSTITSTDGSGCLTFRFTSDVSVVGTGFQADINCYQEGPVIIIDDIAFDEDVGNAVFTVRSTRAPHGVNTIFGFFETSFTVNFQTVDGSALAGSDYTATSGTITFDGSIGNTRTISIPITNDGVPEFDENFSIIFTGANAPNAPVNYNDTGTGTINSQILANDPLTLFQSFDGKYDYAVTGGTLRSQSNTVDPCAIQASSSNQLISNIPVTGTVAKAYLYWAHSSTTRDDQVTFEGQTVNAGFVYQTTLQNMNFYGYVSDVTNIINNVPNLNTNTFDFSGLTIDNTGDYCTRATTLGGWSLFVFYEEPSLPAVNINLYQGFDGLTNSGTSFTLDSFYAIAGSGAKATFLSWEGDATLDSSSSGSTNPELLSITNQSGTNFSLTGDGGQTGNNAYNSTIYDNSVGPVYNTSGIYGLDLDTFDISGYISPGDSQVTANVDMGQDYVINMAVVLKVPSNLISGSVFEDINYPGGSGRDQVTSSGVGVSGAVVELFESNGTFIERRNTDVNGDYSFGGMPDGSYRIKVVSSTVRSNRGGGLNCSDCFPVQTFRRFGDATTKTDVTQEIGGADPAATLDAALGVLTGALSVSDVTVASNGVTDIDFGFNFNTIVNTNVEGHGSLEQFIINSNNLDQAILDIEANSLFDPTAGDDTSIFMIPTSSDPLGRTADANYTNGHFNIALGGSDQLSEITDASTIIDGRTQTAYSGDTNAGTVGSGGSLVGVSGTALPNFDRPEIQIYRNNGDVLKVNGNSTGIRNISVYSNNNSGIQMNGGSLSVSQSLIGVNAEGISGSNIKYGLEILGGTITLIAENYISGNTDAGIYVNGGNLIGIQDNHITGNGNAACDDNITIQGGVFVTIQRNLIEQSASAGIDVSGVTNTLNIEENTITSSGQHGGNCSGSPQQMGLKIDSSVGQINYNVIYQNGGAGVVIFNGTGNTISQNSIYANGTAVPSLGIDLNNDGVTLNDLNDADGGPNGSINFPIISGNYGGSANLTVEGWSRPGATIEFFMTDISEGTATLGDNQLGLLMDYGEGQIYIGTMVEGSASDLDSKVLPYTDTDGNTDNTNKFKFTFPIPPDVTIGEFVTATATIGNSTSEFSPQSEIQANTLITNKRITYRIKKN